MKLVNADYGIDSIPEDPSDRTWYRWHRFPLLPLWDAAPADKWNTANFSFSWLNLRLWSMDNFSFTLEFSLESKGCFLCGNLPYLRWYLWLLPLPRSWNHKFSRKPAGAREGSNA